MRAVQVRWRRGGRGGEVGEVGVGDDEDEGGRGARDVMRARMRVRGRDENEARAM